MISGLILTGCMDTDDKIPSESTEKTIKEVATETGKSFAAGETITINPQENMKIETTKNDKQATEKLENQQVTLKTNKGDIVVELYTKDTPKAAKNFYELSKTGKYDGTIFHRVIKGFMIQGGDYENFNGTGGQSIYGKEFENEIVDKYSNVRGALAMANRGKDTNGSQFFIVHEDATYLDGNYTVFGKVIEGMDVVDAIANTKTGMNDKPLEDIKIEKAIVKE